jgi:peptidoglycan/LPS O-acetylase OafA/YrhL
MVDNIALPKHRLQWIDSLRGIAALMVVLLHLWQSIIATFKVPVTGGVKILSYIVFDYTDFGKIGVVAFFIISGYVIPYSFKNKTIKQFFANRFFRLYPAYWFSIICFVIVMGMPPVKVLAMNLTMLHRFVGIDDLIGAFWTLQIEIIFYCLCAFLHHYKVLESDKVIIRVVVFFILLALATAFLRYQLNKKLPVALFLALAVMFLGLIWRRFTLDRSKYLTKKMVSWTLIIFFTALFATTILAYSRDYGFGETWYRYFCSYLVAFMIFFWFSYYKFDNPILLYLGSISYSLYLLHSVFGLNLGINVMRAIGSNNVYLYTLFFLFFSFISSSLCYFFIEKPSVKLGKRILNK